MQKRKKSRLKKKPRASFLQGPIHRTKIRIVGIGGGGSSIVSEIAQRIAPLGKEKISFFVANTDLRALKKTSTKAHRFYFGKEITSGLGTGMNPELGEIAAQKEKEKISKILKNQDLVILVSSLGGGVGSGATPIFAKISKKLGNLTYGIFTLPFRFEGEKKIEIAERTLRSLRRYLNTLTIIPNERIFQIIDKKTPLTSALSIINKNLTKSLEGLLEMIYQPGLINIDFADFKTILGRRGKIAYLNTVEVKGENRVQKAVEELISSPLYPYQISGAKGILFNISGEENLKLSEVGQISQTIWKLVKGKAKIIFGISRNKELRDKIKITLLATGCRSRISFLKPRSRKISLPEKKRVKRKKITKEEAKKKIKIKVKIRKKRSVARKKKRKNKKTKIRIKPKVPNLTKEKKETKDKTEEEGKTLPKIRRNALQIKEDLKEEEEKILAEEKKWEIPAFLRRKE